ncbi:hypothetical protein HJC99_02155 [Candidatus Saccharibacteria bacterium]|nr:hypothetical protein [Candidatus Saccharibacteria bacterium]
MTVTTLSDRAEAVSLGAELFSVWRRMLSREARISARISARDEANKADREELDRLSTRDRRQVDALSSKVVDYVLGHWEELDAQGGKVDFSTFVAERYPSKRPALAVTDDTLNELRLLVANGTITQDEFDSVTTTSIKKDALKGNAKLMALLRTSSLDPGDFLALAFPTIRDTIHKSVADWRAQIIRSFVKTAT